MWPHPLSTPRSIALAFGAVGLVLVPWTAWLSSSLPASHHTDHWDLAWSGFDAGLAVLFLLTALAAWHRHRWLPEIAAATGALLVADAWFDIVLENRSSDIQTALIEAFVLELPIAAACFWVSHVTSRARQAHGGEPGADGRAGRARTP